MAVIFQASVGRTSLYFNTVASGEILVEIDDVVMILRRGDSFGCDLVLSRHGICEVFFISLDDHIWKPIG